MPVRYPRDAGHPAQTGGEGSPSGHAARTTMPTDAMQDAPHAGTTGDPAHAGPTPIPKAVLCPYCGHLSLNTSRCESCRGYFDPLSRQASQNSMGPWFVRDEANPFRPGCSFDTLCSLIRRGKVGPETVLRGPTTRQFWTFARNTPGVAHQLGECHNCHAPAAADDRVCRACGADFTHADDRQHLGLAPVHLLPGHTSPEIIAASALRTPLAPASPSPVSVPPAPLPVGAGAAVLPPELLTPALDRVAGPSARRRRDGTMVWIGIGLGAAGLTALLAFALNRTVGGTPTTPQQPTGSAPAVIAPAVPIAPSEKPVSADPAASPSSTHAPEQGEPAPAQTPSSQELGASPAGRPPSPEGADALARLLAQPGGAGLSEAEAILADPEHSAAALGGFRGILPARRTQARLSAAL